MSSSRLKILYIAGESRSGSTILGQILGETPHFFFTGEILNIWRHYLINDRDCACGLPASQCEVWSNIFHTAFNMETLNVEQMETWRLNSVRYRFAWKMLLSIFKPQLKNDLKHYLKNIENLYRAISQTTGAKIIVDSSKRPTYAFLLGLIPTVDVFIVHLVRDSRGVAYSWKKKKIQQHTIGNPVYMRQFTPLRTAWRWNISNLLTELLLQKSSNYLRVRYEDFVHDPTCELSKIFQLIGLSKNEIPTFKQKKIWLSANHGVWGNPSRFENGEIELLWDNEWQSQLPMKTQRVVKMLTWVGLRRYRYL